MQLYLSLNSIFWFLVEGPLASDMNPPCFWLLICDLGNAQPPAKHCWKITYHDAGTLRVLPRPYPLPPQICSMCEGKELTSRMKKHWNMFIIPTSWEAGEREGCFEGRILAVPANQKSLITFNSPRGSLSRLSYLLSTRKAALALLTQHGS